jgi:thiol-disulfide isomerase/thioredoxin
MDKYGSYISTALLLGLLGFGVYSGLVASDTEVVSGQAAAAFDLPPAHGGESTGPQDYLGRVVLIDFWASYCGPCQEAMPAMQAIHETYDPDQVALLSVNVDPRDRGISQAQIVESVRRQMGLTFPVLLDDGAGAAAYQVETIPHIVVIDRQGMVRYIHRAPVSEERLREEIEGLLAETPST